MEKKPGNTRNREQTYHSQLYTITANRMPGARSYDVSRNNNNRKKKLTENAVVGGSRKILSGDWYQKYKSSGTKQGL